MVRKIAGILVISITLAATAASANDFSVEFKQQRGLGGARICSLDFDNALPPKAKVDVMMTAALQLCISRDDSQDIVLQVSKNDELLPAGAATYEMMTYEHKTRQISRRTAQDFLKGLKPVDR